MVHQHSHSLRPDGISCTERSQGAITTDIFAVFPDGSILWDSAQDSSHASNNPRPIPSDQYTPRLPIHPDAQLQGTHDNPVQYHIHYHLLSGNRLFMAFLVGGAIALGMGSVYVQYHVPSSPNAVPSLEQRQSQ